MKNKFIFVATLLFSAMMIMTSFAAKNEWVNDGIGWKYYNSDECEVSCEWKKSGNDWYYLGDDGYMVTSTLIDADDNSLYYVDETGKRVYNVWEKLSDESRSIEDEWLYFKSNGKSVNSGWYAVSNVKYCFANNVMLTGFIANGAEVDTYAEAEYYCGENGAKVVGWLETEDSDGNNLWIYLKSGKKVTDCILTIDNQKYMFDVNGKMLTGIQATGSVYYNFDSNGHMVRKNWVEKTDDAGDTYWIYCKADGTLVESGQYKINSKYYFFVDHVMKTGWHEEKYYASNGAMVTGRVTITDSNGDDIIYVFTKDGVPSVDGANGYAYTTDADGHGGKLVLPADDHKYVVYNNKLVNKSGKYQGKGTYKDTAYDKTYVVDENGIVTVQ